MGNCLVVDKLVLDTVVVVVCKVVDKRLVGDKADKADKAVGRVGMVVGRVGMVVGMKFRSYIEYYMDHTYV